MTAFGAKPGTNDSAHTEPAREGKGANAQREAGKGDVHQGTTGAGVKGSGKGFGK